MKKMSRGRLTLVILLFLGGFEAITVAAPNPAYVERIKQEAPLHVTAEVTRDEFAEDLTDDNQIPSQARTSDLKIIDIHKKPAEMQLAPDQTLQIRYTYIPEWLKMTGSARVDLRKGDRIEIWLTKKEDDWVPAYSGNTINFISQTKFRIEHMPEPLSHKLLQITELDIKSVLLFSFAALAVIVIIVRDLLHHRIKKQGQR